MSVRSVARRLPPRAMLVALALCVLAGAAVARPSPALAHGKLLRSYPSDGAVLAEPPDHVQLWFNEDVDESFSAVRVEDGDGADMRAGKVVLNPIGGTSILAGLPALEPGVYRVTWKVLSRADAHVTRGTVVFRVGSGPPVRGSAAPESAAAASWREAAVRWSNLLATACLVGAIVVIRLALAGDIAPRRIRRRAVRFALASGAAALATGIAVLWWQSHVATETSALGVITGGGWWSILSQTRWGALWLLRMCAIVALAATTVAPRALASPARWVTAMLVCVLALAHALGGHAAAIESQTAVSVLADALHLLAASAWLGGLAAMMMAVGWRRPGGSDPAEIARTAMLRSRAWSRFGKIAVVSVLTLVATGLYATGREVSSPDALLSTFYGQVLAAKIVLTAGVCLLGAFNAALLRRWLGRRRGHHGWLMALEAAGGAVVLVAVALLASAAPARGPEFQTGSAPRSFMSARAGDLLVTLSVKPNEPGANLADIRVASTRRPALAPVSGVSVRFVMPGGDSATTVDAVHDGGDQYHVSGEQLNDPGAWTIEVLAHHDGLPDTTARFDWSVRDPAAVAREPRFSTRPLRGPLTGAAIAIGVVGVIVVLALLGGPPLRALPSWPVLSAAVRARRAAP